MANNTLRGREPLDGVGIVAQGSIKERAPAIITLDHEGDPVWVVDHLGNIHHPLDDVLEVDGNGRIPIGQYSSVRVSDGRYFNIWDAVCDLPDVISVKQNKYLLVPKAHVQNIQNAAKLYVDSENYAELTFEEFLKRVFNAHPTSTF